MPVRIGLCGSYTFIRLVVSWALGCCRLMLWFVLAHGDGLELPRLVGDVDLYVLGLGHELHGLLLEEEVIDDHARVNKDIYDDNTYYYTGESHKLLCKRLRLLALNAAYAVLAEHLVACLVDFGDIGHRQFLALGDGVLVNLFLSEDFQEQLAVTVGLEYILLGCPCAALL